MVFRYAIIIIRLLFAVLFTLSAYTKFSDIQTFAQSMNSYQILPEDLVKVFALYVPFMEAGLVVGFLWPSFGEITAVLTTVVLVVFQIALASLIVRGIAIDCGCFGKFATTPKTALIRNFALLIFCGLLLFSFAKSKKLQKRNTSLFNEVID